MKLYKLRSRLLFNYSSSTAGHLTWLGHRPARHFYKMNGPGFLCWANPFVFVAVASKINNITLLINAPCYYYYYNLYVSSPKGYLYTLGCFVLLFFFLNGEIVYWMFAHGITLWTYGKARTWLRMMIRSLFTNLITWRYLNCFRQACPPPFHTLAPFVASHMSTSNDKTWKEYQVNSAHVPNSVKLGNTCCTAGT